MQTIALAERMAAKGNVVSLLVLKHADEEWPVKLPVMRLNMDKSAGGLWRSWRFARKFMTVFKPELLHSHCYHANLFSRLLIAGFKIGQVTPLLVNTIHNVYEGGWGRMMSYRLTSFWADDVTAVSTAAVDRYVRIGAVPRKKMCVLTNGIDVNAFAPDRSRRQRMRNLMQASDGFVWLAVGRISQAKDYPNLLRAFALVRREQPEVQLWIAGEGDMSELESIAEENSGVRFLGLRRDVVDLMDAADGFVLSSAWEGMPLVLEEAMAMEKVVVATNVGGVKELVGNAGMLVEAGDSQALSETMAAVMTMGKKERTAIGKAARERICQSFSMEMKAAEWETFYAAALAGRRR